MGQVFAMQGFALLALLENVQLKQNVLFKTGLRIRPPAAVSDHSTYSRSHTHMETHSAGLYVNYRSTTHIKALPLMKITFYIFF